MPELARGRICMNIDEQAFLREAVKGARTYVEIGTLWGGSFIEALLANPKLRGWAIDPMTGYYGKLFDEDWPDEQPNLAGFWENIDAAGLRERTTLVTVKSQPFPLAGMRFDIGLIDGDHSIENERADWQTLCCCCKSILIHDVDHPDIALLLDEIRSDGYCVEVHGRLALCKP